MQAHAKAVSQHVAQNGRSRPYRKDLQLVARDVGDVVGSLPQLTDEALAVYG